jgi:hypothetical protein
MGDSARLAHLRHEVEVRLGEIHIRARGDHPRPPSLFQIVPPSLIDSSGQSAVFLDQRLINPVVPREAEEYAPLVSDNMCMPSNSGPPFTKTTATSLCGLAQDAGSST